MQAVTDPAEWQKKTNGQPSAGPPGTCCSKAARIASQASS
eukprot:CAMPEP_0115574546 /NCGR_PEP_ID=MMETSP0272-20121206/1581_1 /TAXON_ID=71861 /ORGANISM="Scrippsiella trochoidea, Strain CCMP3099" /LENGTH=39 /DNA_ID= /DNA_START= /DNA_END= /DNA_ORIENTATION=